eukprot:6285534-Amphidinium_carterae.1
MGDSVGRLGRRPVCLPPNLTYEMDWASNDLCDVLLRAKFSPPLFPSFAKTPAAGTDPRTPGFQKSQKV